MSEQVLEKEELKHNEYSAKALSIMQIQAGGGEVRLFSALKKKGVDDVALLLWQWTHKDWNAIYLIAI